MKYYDFLEMHKKDITEQIEVQLRRHKVEPVGSGYIDCIVLKNNLEEFVANVSTIGVLITSASWWCYVNPSELNNKGCPHGMGGPKSEYHDGWFSELQNDFYELDDRIINQILDSYDKNLIETCNRETLEGIKKMLETPFRYTPTEYIEGNQCVTPGLWLLIPEGWRR